MQEVTMQVEDKDLAIIKPLLDRMGIVYQKATLLEDSDPVLAAEADKVKHDKPASKKENENFQEFLKKKIE